MKIQKYKFETGNSASCRVKIAIAVPPKARPQAGLASGCAAERMAARSVRHDDMLENVSI